MTGDTAYVGKAFEHANIVCAQESWIQSAHSFDVIYPRVWPYGAKDDQVVFSYDITASAVTGGIQVDGGILASGNNQRIGRDAVLGRTIMSLGNDATSDILTLAAIRSGSSNASVKSVLKWKEIQ
jgi:hypothetical protein